MDEGPGEAASGVLTLEGLGFQVAIGERGSQTQSVTTDEGGDVRGGEGQGCPCDLVQQTWHPAGYSAFRACKRQEGRKWGEVPPSLPSPGLPFRPHRRPAFSQLSPRPLWESLLLALHHP